MTPLTEETVAAAPEAVRVIGIIVAALLAATALLGRSSGTRAWSMLAALPFRVPIEAGGQTANLLVPLYLVICLLYTSDAPDD